MSCAERVIALAGNPNVGKSTVFNALTGMNQHTGNWPGKTVAIAQGRRRFEGCDYTFVDLPGTYSIMAHSAEEEIARDFILFGGAKATIVVCDATCLERNLYLALQIMEITQSVIICVNLLDEARKKGLRIDIGKLEMLLGVPVVGTSARSGEGLADLMRRTAEACAGAYAQEPRKAEYPSPIPGAIAPLSKLLAGVGSPACCGDWLALRLLEGDPALRGAMRANLHFDPLEAPAARAALAQAAHALGEAGIPPDRLKDIAVSCIVRSAEEVAAHAVSLRGGCAGCGGCRWAAGQPGGALSERDRALDRILTGRRSGIPIMLALLFFIFWLTLSGANYPSQLLSDGLFRLQDHLSALFQRLGAPDWLHGLLVLGAYRVLAWVVSVMLPPMAIFFPLFTLLEDFGYLPRVAFNLDHGFKKARACGKQALTMCMGFGCNAVGVTGCRIIDSPRERLIAILTNNFVPCNGRFPALIAIISMFFAGALGGALESLMSTALLTLVIVLGVLLTLWVSRLLSVTILRGEPSFFALELPPYRMPQFGKVIVRSIFDRTLFVLGRAAAVAAPAGALIWALANISVGGATLLSHCAAFLDPLGRLLGMDGVILIAFILGFPANEIVVPIMIMTYMSSDAILTLGSLAELKALLLANGWTWVTAVSTALFCLIHWPCSTTCLTIKKETGSFKWTALSMLIPTAVGMAACFLFAAVARLLGVS